MYKRSLENEGPNGWQLRAMATLPEYQGKGYGSELLKSCINSIKEKNGNYIWCNARKVVVDYYKQFGLNILSNEFEVAEIGPHSSAILNKFQNKLVDTLNFSFLDRGGSSSSPPPISFLYAAKQVCGSRLKN